MMTPYGNVDTEMGGIGQPFPDSPITGNRQSDTANYNSMAGYGSPQPASDPMRYYFELGQQLLQQQQAMQQQVDSGQMPAAPASSLNLGNQMLTAGYDPDWLTQRIAAASVDGAKIGTISSDSRGGGFSGFRGAGSGGYGGGGAWGPTVRNGDPSTLKGANLLMK